MTCARPPTDLVDRFVDQLNRADEAGAQSNLLSARAAKVTKNLETVAAATEEMGMSIKGIAKNANEAARGATSAVKTAETPNATVAQLGEPSAEIGQVIEVITSPAQETNLLALNATLEAARAGEAGKGLAFVAQGANETQTAAAALARMATERQKVVARFTYEDSATSARASNLLATANLVRDAHLASRVSAQTGASARLQ